MRKWDDILQVHVYDIDDTLTTRKSNHYIEEKTPIWEWEKKIVAPEQIVELLKNKSRYRAPDGDIEKCYSSFRDGYPENENTFPNFVTTSINNSELWPLHDDFVEKITAGELVGVMTDRGHARVNLSRWLQDLYLQTASYFDKIKCIKNLVEKYPFLYEKFWRQVDFSEYLQVYFDLWEYFRYIGVHNRAEFFNPFDLEKLDVHSGERKAFLLPYSVAGFHQLRQKYFPQMWLAYHYYDNSQPILSHMEKNLKDLEWKYQDYNISVSLYDQYGDRFVSKEKKK